MNKFSLLTITLCLPAFLIVSGCDNDPLSSVPQAERAKVQVALDDLIARTEQDMILIEGGEFFFRYVDPVRWRQESDVIGGGIPVAKNSVRLDNYLLSRYQITIKDYLLFRKIKGWMGINYTEQEKAAIDSDIEWALKGKWEVAEQYPIPVKLPWREAQRYCEWLGTVVGDTKGSLPTSAQWEYAASSRGSGAVFATDNDRYQITYNVPSVNDIEWFSYMAVGAVSTLKVMPVGSYPASPLGLYDMASNGDEWVYDWYDENYYKELPQGVVNPQGQTQDISYQKYERKGMHYKEVRYKSSGDNPSSLIEINGKAYDSYMFGGSVEWAQNTARCVINQPNLSKPIK